MDKNSAHWAIEATYQPGTRVRVTDRSLRLRRSPGEITKLNIGRGATTVMVQLDRADYTEPLCFDIDQILVEG